MNTITRFLSNDSMFGRLMTKAGIFIAVNLLFLLGCLGVVTAGASLCALYYTEMRYLRGEREMNPFRVRIFGEFSKSHGGVDRCHGAYPVSGAGDVLVQSV